MVKHFIPASDRHRVRAAIRAAEARTCGELVAVVARTADHYWPFSLTWATLGALLAPAALMLAHPGVSLDSVYLTQLVLFATLLVVLHTTRVKMFFIPEPIKVHAARRLAREQFVAHRLHHTRQRSGVLLFVSVAEHYVEILADEGVASRVAPHEWDAIVAGLVARVRTGAVGQGFVEAIDRCGDLLAQHCAIAPGDKNELPDRLIEI